MLSLNVPYRSQLDNWFNPGGSCNVTSLAMCLEFLKAERKPRYSSRFKQFEDELYQFALDNKLSRHHGGDLAKIVGAYGRRDIYTENASIQELKDWLSTGNPGVIHGYFTTFGHIITVIGYDATGFYVHDPYGEYFPTGYRTDLSGANLHYSYNLIKRVCIPDGKFWVHFISK